MNQQAKPFLIMFLLCWRDLLCRSGSDKKPAICTKYSLPKNPFVLPILNRLLGKSEKSAANITGSGQGQIPNKSLSIRQDWPRAMTAKRLVDPEKDSMQRPMWLDSSRLGELRGQMPAQAGRTIRSVFISTGFPISRSDPFIIRGPRATCSMPIGWLHAEK